MKTRQRLFTYSPWPIANSRLLAQRGVTLLELMMTIAIILVLASVAMPLTKVTSKRSQELELRQQLRNLRMAIDEFHKDWSRDGEVLTGPLCIKNKLACKEIGGVTGYPKSLETMLEVKLTGAEATVKEGNAVRRYLRRVPLDPLTGSKEWGLRCYQDPPDARSWCKEDVFDVYSKSDEIATDGSKYRDW